MLISTCFKPRILIKMLPLLYYRRAPPGKCNYEPLSVRVKSSLIPFKPKESKFAYFIRDLVNQYIQNCVFAIRHAFFFIKMFKSTTIRIR